MRFWRQSFILIKASRPLLKWLLNIPRGAIAAFSHNRRYHSLAKDPINNISDYYKIVSIMNMGNTAAFFNQQPQVAHKYLGGYLAKQFDRRSRHEIMCHHYSFIEARVNATFYKKLLGDEIVLWSHRDAETIVEISLSFDKCYSYEGDLSVLFRANGATIYEVSFTIVPGRLIGATTAPAVLVARVQGCKEQFTAIKRATKLCCDISPPYLLLAAVQGLATALNIDNIAGLSGKDQLTLDLDTASRFDYDKFWTDFQAVPTLLNFFMFRAAYPGKPIEQINASHRRRARRKRQFKKQIAAHVGASFAKNFLEPDSAVDYRPAEQA